MDNVPAIVPFSQNTKANKTVKYFNLLTTTSPIFIYILFFLLYYIYTDDNNKVFAAIIGTLVVGTIFNFILGRIIYPSLRAIFYKKLYTDLNKEVSLLNINPSLTYGSAKPTPNIMAVDIASKKIFIENNNCNYYRLVIEAEKIIGAKVERESQIDSITRNGGSISLFSRGGFGYNFGSKSKTTSKVTEYAYLEIHYKNCQTDINEMITVPFGTDRRGADQILVSIQQICKNI